MTHDFFLPELKNGLKSHAISLLVGSGFSKNVSDLFPDWRTLLKDMARALYEQEIKNQFQHSPVTSTEEEYKKYLIEELDAKIFRTGYLEMVSEFIRRHGYREVIENYIEERVPQIVLKDGLKYLRYNERGAITETPLKEDDFKLPVKLLELPWTNVFTTNYDNVLENAVDLLLYEEQKKSIQALKQETVDIEVTIKQKEIEHEKLGMELFTLQSGAEIVEGQVGAYPDKAQPVEEESNKEKRIKELLDNRFRLIIEIDTQKSNLTKIIRRTEHMLLSLNDCWTLITHSGKLAIKKNRNIIKLHGTLRSSPAVPFEFDGDARKCYVISKEDYDSYPVKHEAFTQLMRISLLRDAFCLIGFSGDDPNFMGWLNWVRDVVMRKHATDELPIKIFFIDISRSEPSAQKKVFYANHRIVHIPLTDERVLSYLAKQTNRSVPASGDRKGALLLLIEYMQEGLFYNSSELKSWQLLVQDYETLWKKMAPTGHSDIELAPIVENIENLKTLREQVKLPDIQFAYHSNRQMTRELAINALNAAQTAAEKGAVLELLLLALKESYLPYSYSLSEEEMDIILREALLWPSLHTSFLHFCYINAVWKNDAEGLNKFEQMLKERTDQVKDIPQHFQILYQGQNLHFRKAKALLDRWMLTNDNILIKAGLSSLFDAKSALQMINEFDTINPQEMFHKLMLQQYFKRAMKIHPVERDERINLLIDAGANTLDANLNHLIQVVKEKKENLIPAGDDKFMISRSMQFDNSPKEMESVQFFGLLMDWGMPLGIPEQTLKRIDDVIPIALKAMDYYCFPVFFYMIQTSNEKLCRMAGQKLCYMKYLEEERNEIMSNIRYAFDHEELSPSIKQSLTYFLAELAIAYEPELWEGILSKVWLEREKSLFQQFYKKKHPFILKGLQYIRDVNIVSKIISDCLKNRNLEKTNPSIEYLYQLTTNPFYKELSTQLRGFEPIIKQIDETIASLEADSMQYIFILANIYELLSIQQIDTLKQKLWNIQFIDFESPKIWNVLIYFSKNDPHLIKKVTTALLTSQRLWDSGIKDDLKSSSSTNNFININSITKTSQTSDGIEWTQEEVTIIAKKLINEFVKIRRIIDKNQSSDYHFQNYEQILEEMVNFIDLHKRSIGDLISESLGVQIRDEYLQQRGFRTIQEGLISDDKTTVILALNELSNAISATQSLKDHLPSIEYVIMRILLMKEPGIAESIEYLSRWIFKNKASDEVKQLIPQLMLVIKKYRDEIPPTLELPSLQAAMIRIASSIKLLGEKNEDIDHWMNVLRTSEYLNIKYKLAKTI